MPALEYVTAGESHGPAVVVIVSGLPAGLPVDPEPINRELSRRQGGYGRSGRQRIEQDRVEFVSGLYRGKTIGSPLTMRIANRDARLPLFAGSGAGATPVPPDRPAVPPVHRPRPGHADLAGALKYLTPDCRPVLERASARETAARTAAGALVRQLLSLFGIEVFGFVRSIGGVATDVAPTPDNWRSLRDARDRSETYCPDEGATARQCEAIRHARQHRDTVGGLVEAHAFGVMPGLGSCMDWRDRLDARLAFAVMSIQAIKAVEIGLGREVAARPGSAVHDPIRYDPARVESCTLGFVRDSNNAGGLEGGMTNGQPVVVRAAMKPIATLGRGMPSVDLMTGQAQPSAYERSDICAVPAASVVVENVVAFEIARAFRDRFAGDTLDELKLAVEHYQRLARLTFAPIPPAHTLA